MLRAKPQRHRGTETAQSQPPTSQPRRHEDTKTSQSPLDHPARSRPPGGQGPLGAGATSDASARSCTHSQRPALSESAGLASHVDRNLAFEQARMRRDRRAASASAGGKSDRDGCLHPERSGFSPGAGDLRIAGVAAAPLRATSSPQESLLCVLRVFVVATILGSVSLCLCGFSENTGQHSEFRIPNSEFS